MVRTRVKTQSGQENPECQRRNMRGHWTLNQKVTHKCGEPCRCRDRVKSARERTEGPNERIWGNWYKWSHKVQFKTNELQAYLIITSSLVWPQHFSHPQLLRTSGYVVLCDISFRKWSLRASYLCKISHPITVLCLLCGTCLHNTLPLPGRRGWPCPSTFGPGQGSFMSPHFITLLTSSSPATSLSLQLTSLDLSVFFPPSGCSLSLFTGVSLVLAQWLCTGTGKGREGERRKNSPFSLGVEVSRWDRSILTDKHTRTSLCSDSRVQYYLRM